MYIQTADMKHRQHCQDMIRRRQLMHVNAVQRIEQQRVLS